MTRNHGDEGVMSFVIIRNGQTMTRTIFTAEALTKPNGHLTPAFMAQQEN